MTYIFAKTFVHDLDAMAAFYEAVFGLIPFGRHQDKMLGRDVDEVTYQSSYPGGPALTLIKYLDSTAPTAGEAVQGYMSDELEALVERALAHHDPHRITRDQSDEREGQQRDAQEGGYEHQQSLEKVSQHERTLLVVMQIQKKQASNLTPAM